MREIKHPDLSSEGQTEHVRTTSTPRPLEVLVSTKDEKELCVKSVYVVLQCTILEQPALRKLLSDYTIREKKPSIHHVTPEDLLRGEFMV